MMQMTSVDLHNLKLAFKEACRARAAILNVINNYYHKEHGCNWDFTKEFCEASLECDIKQELDIKYD
jgi:hypothetical protein